MPIYFKVANAEKKCRKTEKNADFACQIFNFSDRFVLVNSDTLVFHEPKVGHSKSNHCSQYQQYLTSVLRSYNGCVSFSNAFEVGFR
jgi:hypothetical protein